jgi:hypothetical protein
VTPFDNDEAPGQSPVGREDEPVAPARGPGSEEASVSNLEREVRAALVAISEPTPVTALVEAILSNHPGLAGPDAAWHRMCAAVTIRATIERLLRPDATDPATCAEHADELRQYREARHLQVCPPPREPEDDDTD